MIIIPTRHFPAFTETVTLDGEPYDLEFRWNTREEAWHLDIRQGGTDVLLGLKLVSNWNLVDMFGLRIAPPGALFTLDQTSGSKAGRTQIGDSFLLLYATEDEQEAVRNAV